MSRRKIFRQIVMILLIFTGLLSAATVHAELKTFEGVGEYFMTDETVDFAKNQAELAAQRDILDKVCVHVKGQSKMIDNELDNDEIITVSAGILHVIDTKFFMTKDNSGMIIKSFVTAQIDIAETIRLLEQTIKERKGE